MGRLRRVDCASAGIARRRRGRGFEYLDACGRRIDDLPTLERIRALAIPPAWTDVWICADPDGHLQAVGTDAAGRRQYRYHARWRARRDQEKFDRMLEFAHALPRVRRAATRDLRRGDLSREQVLACAVRLLDRGFFRVGGEEYAKGVARDADQKRSRGSSARPLQGNGSYGLATLERRHVSLAEEGVLVFDYVAKAGKRRLQAVVDPDVYEVVRALKRRRGGGRALLAYRDGGWVDVRSSDINEYVKELAGGEFTAKDFRTWHATVLAAVALAVSTAATTKTARKRAMARAVQEVSHYLGNTPAVCRASYIDPRIFDRYLAGATIAPALGTLAEVDDAPATQGKVEAAVLELLEERLAVGPKQVGSARGWLAAEC